MSQFIKFYFTSSMLNMFRTLIHPSSGACDFFYCITTLVVCSCFDPLASGIRILIPLASSQHNLYDLYLLLCVQC